MDINSVTNVEQASAAHKNCSNEDEKDSVFFLWDWFSMDEVLSAKDENDLEFAFLSCPPGGVSEKAAIQKMDEFAKKKKR